MSKDDLRVGLYSRVSGDQQEKEDTIASQLEAIMQRIGSDGVECDADLQFVDDGYSGYILARPGLERLRDQAAAGVIDRLYVLDPDRFSRKYAYQVLIIEELTRCGVEIIFLWDRSWKWSQFRSVRRQRERWLGTLRHDLRVQFHARHAASYAE